MKLGGLVNLLQRGQATKPGKPGRPVSISLNCAEKAACCSCIPRVAFTSLKLCVPQCLRVYTPWWPQGTKACSNGFNLQRGHHLKGSVLHLGPLGRLQQKFSQKAHDRDFTKGSSSLWGACEVMSVSGVTSEADRK